MALTELKTAIFQMENGKSPGLDGLPIEFYKSQYDVLKHDLLQLYNPFLFQNENLTPSLTQTIMTLIPKTTKNNF